MHGIKHRSQQKHVASYGKKYQRNDTENFVCYSSRFVLSYKYAAVYDETDKNVTGRSHTEHHQDIAAGHVVHLEDISQNNTQPNDTRKDYEQYVCLAVATHLFQGVRFCDF